MLYMSFWRHDRVNSKILEHRTLILIRNLWYGKATFKYYIYKLYNKIHIYIYIYIAANQSFNITEVTNVLRVIKNNCFVLQSSANQKCKIAHNDLRLSHEIAQSRQNLKPKGKKLQRVVILNSNHWKASLQLKI